MTDRREVTFKAGYWYYEEVEGKTVIHIGGRTADNKSVHALINNFTPFVYVELPRRVSWNKYKAATLYEYLQRTMKSEGPIQMSLHKKYRLHYLKEVYVMFLAFPTNTAARKLQRKCSNARGFAAPGIGTFQGNEFKVHESNIDPVLKFAAAKRLILSNWMTVRETIPEDELDLTEEDRRFATTDIDLQADWTDANPAETPANVHVPPYYCSFDIECNSKNHNSKLPCPDLPENLVFQIAMVFGFLGGAPSDRHRVLLSLGKPRGGKISNCDDLIVLQTEGELLLKFAELIRQYNPDILIGYNTMKFDWNYMIARADKAGIYPKFSMMSRIMGKHADLATINWNSAAYGEQKFSYLECHGRTNVDVLIEVERNFKLPKYSLDSVSEYFLKKQKDDVSPRGLFMLYQLTNEVLPLVHGRKIDIRELLKHRKRVQEIFEKRKCHGVVKKYRARLLKARAADFPDLCCEAMEITGKYCIQDTILPIELAEKLNLWTTMEEMSNVTHVPASYLHTRGQQIKVLAQIYRRTIRQNIVIPNLPKSDKDERYQGAIVIEANEGDYELVVTLDFASLYPTVMIAFNICYTTILEDHDPTPDSECHVLEWADHVACECDPQKRKRKKEDILCCEHRYRFRKVQYVINENGEVGRRHEGIMPSLERDLLAERKVHKKEMFKLKVKLDMHKGIISDDDLAYCKKMGWPIIKVGSLGKNEAMMMEVSHGVLDAKQKSVKVSANSAYGAMGVKNGMIPLIAGAASVTAMGRRLIIMAIDRIKKEYAFAKLVYGDTDSCMIHFAGKSLIESFDLAEEASVVATHSLRCYITGVEEDYTVGDDRTPISKMKSKDPRFVSLAYEEQCHVLTYESCPIDLEFENMYGRFLLLTKKRYVAYSVNRKGDVIGVTKKGVVLTRRDNSKYLKDTYGAMTSGILDKRPEKEVMDGLYERINMLFTRQIPAIHLIIYMGIKSVINYAKSRKEKKGRIVISQLPIDSNGDVIDDPIGPLDPRLEYPNYPQVLLSLKMLRRGEEIPANTRLEYVYIRNPEAQHQGEKAEDYTYFKENKDIDGLQADYIHYVEKQLAKPVTELLTVKYSKGIVPFIPNEGKFRVQMSTLNDLHRYRVANTTVYHKLRPSGDYIDPDGCVVGWAAAGIQRPSQTLARDRSFETYTSKKYAAQSTYILDQMKYETGSASISKELYPDFYDLCLTVKSIECIDAIYKSFGITRRRWKKPTYVGEKLRPNVRIVMIDDSLESHDIFTGATGKVLDREEIETNRGTQYMYSILFDNNNGLIIRDVPRDTFTTFIYKDGTVMKDILSYRIGFAAVIGHLNDISCMIEYK